MNRAVPSTQDIAVRVQRNATPAFLQEQKIRSHLNRRGCGVHFVQHHEHGLPWDESGRTPFGVPVPDEGKAKNVRNVHQVQLNQMEREPDNSGYLFQGIGFPDTRRAPKKNGLSLFVENRNHGA
jgi:hypothetical protein